MVKKLVAKVGEYQKDGETKGRYVNIGVILSNDKGEYALLDPSVSLSGVLQMQNRTNHAAGRKTGDKVMVSIFENDRQNGGGQSGGGDHNSQHSGGGSGRFDDEIPF